MTDSERIITQISEITDQKSIHCLHAIESGSRAWGFCSMDSDFDVRMIYCHAPDHYLSIFDKKDSFEFINNNLFAVPFDIGGWDIKKALTLLYKSNAVIFEWLNSPIVYHSHSPFIDNIKSVQREFFNPRGVFYHYHGMAKNAACDLDLSQPIKLKKWFYVLRALLACRWIIQQNDIPPVNITVMLETLEQNLHQEISQLILIKNHHDESYAQRLPHSLQKLTKELWENIDTHNPPTKSKSDSAYLDHIFRQTIYEY